MERQTKLNLWYIVFAFLGVLLLRDAWIISQQVEPLPYSEFMRELKAGNVQEIAVHPDFIQGALRHALPDGRKRFVTTRVETDLARDLAQYDVKFTGVVQSTFFRDLLSWIVPAIVFFALWMFVFRKVAEKGGLGSGFLSIGKSKAKVYAETDVKTTFDDVAGVDEAKEELREVVSFLKNPQHYGRLGARVPKGILLVGPPGTGKTLLARAVAGEAGVPFFSISGSEFVEMFVGVGAARVRDLFEQARLKAPAIVFIDELDALGRARGAYGAGGHDEKEQTLNQLLVEMDGFDASSGLVLLAATNRPEILDPALLRAGRFDRQILVDRPDKAGRLEVLNVHIKRIKAAPDVDREKIAALTTGFSAADIANLVNEAALLATRRSHEVVTMDDFIRAIERIVAGLKKKNRLLNPNERKIVAYHEIGHALVAISLPGTNPVHKVSIIPRSVGALGYTMQRPTEDRFLMTREELENKMAVLLGGRAAEQIVFDHLSTGAADDLAKVTDIARSMVTRYGMDNKLGHLVYEDQEPTFLVVQRTDQRGRSYSEMTAREIDCAVKEIVDKAFSKAVDILSKRRHVLEAAARKLIEKETLTEEDLAVLTGKSWCGINRSARASQQCLKEAPAC
jgi:cell division protease FtsH